MHATDRRLHHDFSKRPGWFCVRRTTAPTTAAQARPVPALPPCICPRGCLAGLVWKSHPAESDLFAWIRAIRGHSFFVTSQGRESPRMTRIHANRTSIRNASSWSLQV